MQEHIYTSAKGENFLSWHNWALQTLSEEDLAIYLDPTHDDPLDTEKTALYERWIIEEQILTHVVMENGQIVMEHEI